MKKLTKITLGKLSASDMRELFGGDKSDSINPQFTKISECCDGKCCTKTPDCNAGFYGGGYCY